MVKASRPPIRSRPSALAARRAPRRNNPVVSVHEALGHGPKRAVMGYPAVAFSILMRADIALVFTFLGGAQIYLDRTTDRKDRYPEGAIRLLRRALGMPALLSLGLFWLDPDIWSDVLVPVSRNLAMVGGLIFHIAALTIFWAHLALRRCWSAELETRADHALVETGPYRWVRHPLYSSYLLIAVGMFLMTGNVLLGASLLAYVLAVAARAWREERMLIERLGAAYVDYMLRTNRFLPTPVAPLHACIACIRQALLR